MCDAKLGIKGLISQQPLTKVIRGSEASNLHVLLIVRPALQNRGYSLQTEKKKKKNLEEREKKNTEKRQKQGEKGKRGGGVIRDRKEELFCRAENHQED